MSKNGKGSTTRPMVISKELYNANYDQAFGKKSKLWWWETPELSSEELVEELENAASEEKRKD